MDKTTQKLTVYFEEPFWVGVFERVSDGKLSVYKVTFGAEPKDYDVLEVIIRRYYQLVFSPSVEVTEKSGHVNPKRRQKIARKQTMQSGVGTRSQQALQLQREEMKTERRHISREERDAKKQRKFELNQQKRKEKHRGR